MSNFRDGNLVQGQPLGETVNVVRLTANNTALPTGGFSQIQIASDNTSATNRVFTLAASALVGHELTLLFTSGSATTAKLANSGIHKLSTDWIPVQYGTLRLVSDGTNWIEFARSPVVVGELPLVDGHILVGNGSGVAADVAMSGDVTIDDTGATTIGASKIVDSKVSASAAIAFSKLAALTSTNILVGNGSNVAAAVAMSGDATLANTGALTIAAGAVTGAKMAALTSTNILVGNGSNVATGVAVSGDATLANTGALTIANLAVTGAKMANATVTSTQLSQEVFQYTASISLSQSDITGLSATPKQLIAAPSAGQIIMVDEIEILHTYSTTVYANGGKLQLQYHGSTDIMDFAVGVVTAASSATYFARPNVYDVDNSTGSTPQALTSLTAKAVDLTNATAPFINGNAANVLKVRLVYRVVTLLT